MSSRSGISRIVLALSFARLGDGVGNSLLFVAIPLYVARMPPGHFAVSETLRVGVLLSVYGFISALGEPLSGTLIDRLGHRKRMVQLGLIVMAACLLGYIPADRYLWLLVLRSVQGVGVAITVPAVLALMASATRTETRGRAMGFYSSARMLGIGVGPLVGGLLQERFGFPVTFAVGAACVGLTVVFVELWVKEPGRERPAPASRPGQEPPRLFDRRIWTSGIVGPAVAMLTMASAFTMPATLERQFNLRLGVGPFLFSIAFSSVTFSRLLCQLPLGSLSDRWGRKPLILAGLLLLAPTTALQGWAVRLWELVALRILQGVASAAIAAPAFALAADASHAGGRGRQMSITTLGFGLGMAVGPLLAGFLATDRFALPFLVAAAMCLVAVWIVHRYTPETVARAAQPARAD